jgi:ATP-dependent DNA ligase
VSFVEVFDDGAALGASVREHELEEVVAKRRSGRYLPGERGWSKVKNRDYWRWELEREGVRASRRRTLRPAVTPSARAAAPGG